MKGAATMCLLAFGTLTLAAPPKNDPRFPKTGKEWTPESLVNPEELGNYFEGDIKLPLPKQGKNGLIDESYRWPNGQVAYMIDSAFSAENKAIVENAFAEYTSRTHGCITFVERTTESNYIYFKQDDLNGCSSYVGMIGGRQEINYPQWCLDEWGSVLHEMLHALGFYHEQARFDRDDYVTIMWQNIKPGTEHNFDKYSESVISGFGENYDYGSVMHYSAYAFSVNGEKTIVTLDPNADIGQRKDLSKVDLNKLMSMYQC